MSNIESGIIRIDSKQARVRKLLDKALKLPLRSEVISVGNGLPRMREAAANGAGTLILWNHFSERDGFDVARRIVVQTPELVDRLNVFPVAQQQDRFPLPWLQEHAAFQYPFIVTKNTFDKVREMLDDGREFIILNNKGEPEKVRDDGTQYLDLRDGRGKFINVSTEALSQGGSVSLSFQGGRTENLWSGEQNTVGAFLVEMKRKRVNNFGVLLVGVGNDRIKDYSKKSSRGVRPFKKTTVRVGEYFTLDEIMNHPEVGGKLRNVDLFIRKQFVPLVPKAYLKAPEVRG